MSYNPKSLFNQIQAKAQSQASSAGQGSFGNPLLFKPKVGTTYAVRLLWLQPEKGYEREWPMINSYIHRIWDDNITSGSKEAKVICPTSQYVMGETSAAFKRCPICEATSEFYKKGQDGSSSAKELYNKFRRTCIGYIPVYIVNGPEEDIGQVRILQYGKQFKDFFDAKIFGIKKTKDADENSAMLADEALGIEAFMYYDETNDIIETKGYNLIITTTSKQMIINDRKVDMPQYSLDFARKMTTITEIDGIDLDDDNGIKYFNTLNESVLHYDRDFYLTSTEEELAEFKLQYISKPVAESVEEDEEEPVSRPPVRPPVKKAKPVVEETPEDEEEEDAIPMHINKRKPVKEAVSELPMTDAGDLDVDSLVNDLIGDN